MKKKICVICLIVSAAWIILLVLHGLGLPLDLKIPAILMGGTVVGIMYTFGAEWPRSTRGLYLVFGFGAAYALVNSYWLMAALAAGAALGVALAARFSGEKNKKSEVNQRAADIEKKLKDCC